MRLVLAFMFVIFGIDQSYCQQAVSKLVYPGNDNRLVYRTDGRGNTIPDFSCCGYMGGGVALPDVPVKLTLSPLSGEGDDTARIQAAIDDVSAMELSNGFRGAVLLKKGTYRVAENLKISASGVVLRGEGQGTDGTIIFATGKKQRTVIEVEGTLNIAVVEGSSAKINDSYVPWGADSFNIDSHKGFAVGDPIILFRPGTAEWIHEIKMDQIVPRNGTQQWVPESYTMRFERKITAIKGNFITIDASVVNAIEDKFGGGSIYRYHQAGRISKCGVENIRIVSEYVKGKEDEDEDHAWTGITVNNAENCWVKNISLLHLSHGILLGRGGKFITVQDCAFLRPVSTISGSRRYPWDMEGQLCFAQRCYSHDARHGEATGSRTLGPNVFLDCLNESTHADTGPHHRWAVGVLWDNLSGGRFNAHDRGNYGTGHGWAGAMQVFWNCVTDSICVQQPPTSQNYAIGCKGGISLGRFPDRTPGHYESNGIHVTPRSLYLKQLEDRLGAKAVENVTIPAQRAGNIYGLLKETLAK